MEELDGQTQVQEVIKTMEEQTEEIEKDSDKENLNSLIDDVKNQYEDKLKKVIADKDRQIAERDGVIKQLLSDDTATEEESFVDKINKKRMFKKW